MSANQVIPRPRIPIGGGYTDGYGWIESGSIELVTSLSQLDWLVDVISETTRKAIK